MIGDTPIEFLKGVGMQKAKCLASELGIYTFWDLLYFFPRKYIDKSSFYKIGQLENLKAEVQLMGKITSIEVVGGKQKKYLRASLEDGSGTLYLRWFRKIEYIESQLKKGDLFVVFGRVSFFRNQAQMVHPELETLETYKSKPQIPLYPIYASSEKLQKSGITNRFILQSLKELFEKLGDALKENFPREIIHKNNLIDREKAFTNIHFPSSFETLSRSQYRLKFEELFFLQWSLLLRKNHQSKTSLSYPFAKVGPLFNLFYENFLPFSLTKAQKRVLKEIREDLGKSTQMNRLLQGDVGSGKTIVAFMSMLLAIDNGFQACLMAPTEVLASQHFFGIKKFCELLKIEVTLLSGSTPISKKKEIYEKIKKNEISLLIGTHALIEEKVKFHNLGLAIIDEQHRFGVAQRASFWKKNNYPPHTLLMSATPIARTLAMSLYGDLDVSILDELPSGRKPIKTIHFYENKRLHVFDFLKKQLNQGRQAYVVYPMIEESKKMDYKFLIDGYESILREFPPPIYHIGILHGKMKQAEKEAEMKKFAEGISHIMVATTVIEVGVNVPNASIIVIENTERFGLLQLHQLRGRVGRGSYESYCILMSSYKLTHESKKRIEVLVATNDGFEIAEEDLKLRGPGDLMGTQQSGVLEMKIANLRQDGPIMARARKSAMELIERDPELLLPENKPLSQALLEYKKKLAWSRIG